VVKPSPMKKVVVAMSGGVDSSIAAALLKCEGYDVSGVSMQLLPEDGSFEDARRSAEILGISHIVVDFRERFQKRVVDYFTGEYRRGRTPNPCIRCNEHIKFGIFLDEALESGADCMATGHYARVEQDGGGYVLKRGADAVKDQSYFLYTLTQFRMRHVLMPLGGRKKSEVRDLAARLGLPTASRPESQEVCFAPSRDYRTFFEERGMSDTPGLIVDSSGRELGMHTGITRYTIGQRKGLGIAGTRPLYVVRIERESNRVVVGERPEGFSTGLVACGLHWTAQPAADTLRVQAKIRSLHTAAPATVVPLGEDKARVIFETPQWAVTPGQAVVLYSGERVLGGGTIEHAE
jgi:tRNA-specific 2-thiouridylase